LDERPIEQLTLRELFGNTEWLVRELNEHLEQSFLPRVRTVIEVVSSFDKPAERDEIADSTVRSRMAALLASDDYSQKLISRLEQHFSAIDEKARRAVEQRDAP
jgi:hypothetical protein